MWVGFSIGFELSHVDGISRLLRAVVFADHIVIYIAVDICGSLIDRSQFLDAAESQVNIWCQVFEYFYNTTGKILNKN